MNNLNIIDTDSVRMNQILSLLSEQAARWQHHIMNTAYPEHEQLEAAKRYHFYAGSAAYYEAKLQRGRERDALLRLAAAELSIWEELSR